MRIFFATFYDLQNWLMRDFERIKTFRIVCLAWCGLNDRSYELRKCSRTILTLANLTRVREDRHFRLWLWPLSKRKNDILLKFSIEIHSEFSKSNSDSPQFYWISQWTQIYKKTVKKQSFRRSRCLKDFFFTAFWKFVFIGSAEPVSQVCGFDATHGRCSTNMQMRLAYERINNYSFAVILCLTWLPKTPQQKCSSFTLQSGQSSWSQGVLGAQNMYKMGAKNHFRH